MMKIPLPGPGQKLRLTIDAIDEEGRGLATSSTPQGDFDVAVRGAFPGDEVRAVVERKVRSQNLVVARALDIYTLGSVRTERACPHHGPCPGCPLEGLERSMQLEIKRQRVLDAIADLPPNMAGGSTVAEVLAHQTGYRSRQRVKLVVGGVVGDLKFGLYAPRSHTLIDAERCPYARETLEHAGLALKERLNAARIPPQTDDDDGLRAVLLRAAYTEEGTEGTAAVLQTGAPMSDDMWNHLVSLVDDKTLLSLAERVIAPDGSSNSLVSGDVIRRTGPDLVFPLDGGGALDPDAFCQTDPDLAARMYEMAARFVLGESVMDATRPPVSTFDAANDDEDDEMEAAPAIPAPSTPPGDAPVGPVNPPVASRLISIAHKRALSPRPLALAADALEDAFVPGDFLDAYAGTGGFSRALLWLGAARVVAIEVAGASASALEQLPVTALLGRVDEKTAEAAATLPPQTNFTGIIADPPRKGLRGDVDALVALKAKRFCLVSCDPGALAKDAAALCAAGYRLEHVVPIDLFPGTPEIEAVAFFTLSEPTASS